MLVIDLRILIILKNNMRHYISRNISWKVTRRLSTGKFLLLSDVRTTSAFDKTIGCCCCLTSSDACIPRSSRSSIIAEMDGFISARDS